MMPGRALQKCPGEMSAALSTTRIDDLAHAIETEHRAALGGFRATIDQAIRCGELLLEAKAALPHGQWLGSDRIGRVSTAVGRRADLSWGGFDRLVLTLAV